MPGVSFLLWVPAGGGRRWEDVGLPCVASDHGYGGSGLVPLGLCEVHPHRDRRMSSCVLAWQSLLP